MKIDAQNIDDLELVGDKWDIMIWQERYVNDGSPTGLTWKNSSSAATCPRHGAPAYYLPLVPADDTDAEQLGLVPAFFHSGFYRIPVHPDCLGLLSIERRASLWRPRMEFMLASQTASPRTALVRTDGWNGFVKLNYPMVLGRYPRELSKMKAQHALNISLRLSSGNDRQATFAFWPETGAIGLRPKGGDKGYYVVFRDLSPLGPLCHKMIPWCSLTAATCYYTMEWEPIILTLARRYGGLHWVLQNVVRSFASSFWHSVKNFALWPEPHAQNVVLGINDDGTTSIFWRDCEGFLFDPEIGTNDSDGLRMLGADSREREMKRSYRYDQVFGHYCIEPLIARLEGLFPSARAAVVAEVKQIAREAIEEIGIPILPSECCWQMPMAMPGSQRLNYREVHNVQYR